MWTQYLKIKSIKLKQSLSLLQMHQKEVMSDEYVTYGDDEH
ncbi:hypothetical protein CJ739_3224 [Mariniflexile rhizosphaerae]|nr:hypothetical protein CJ739_3224 [Mariniflexile sp. TRM1-10]